MDHEERIAELERRVAALEAGQAASRRMPWEAPPPPPIPMGASTPPIHDADIAVGARVLPVVGAAIAALGLVYLTMLAIARGWITPQVQFAGELALSGGLVLFGLLARGMVGRYERWLIGLGFVGLHVSFASAYASKHLITSEALVASFLVLGPLLLVVGVRSREIVLMVLGAIGAMTGALLPLERGSLQPSLWLASIVTVLSVTAGVWRRDQAFAFVAWLLGLIAAIVMDEVAMVEAGNSAAILVAIAAAAGTAGMLWTGKADDARATWVLSGFAAIVSAIVIAGLASAEQALLATYSFVGFMALFGLATVRVFPGAVGFSAVAIIPATLVAPWSMELPWTFGIAAGAGLLATGVSALRPEPALRGYAWFAVWASWCLALIWNSQRVPTQFDPLWIASPLLGVALLAEALRPRLSTESASAAIVTAGVFGALAGPGRALLEQAFEQPSPEVTAMWAATGVVLAVLGFALRSLPIRIAALGLFGCTVAKIVMVDLTALDVAVKAVLLLALGAVLLALGYAYTRRLASRG